MLNSKTAIFTLTYIFVLFILQQQRNYISLSINTQAISNNTFDS